MDEAAGSRPHPAPRITASCSTDLRQVSQGTDLRRLIVAELDADRRPGYAGGVSPVRWPPVLPMEGESGVRSAAGPLRTLLAALKPRST